ncbi:MAG: aminoacyl-tRNA deacylase [Victivallaceae bacterium]|nr:aminoacyl-tRNA deacylase [Victivallaceae bacterium]
MGEVSELKTNVMRLLDQAKRHYLAHCYVESGAVSGLEVAAALGEAPERVFKTLVTIGRSGEHYVFAVPVDCELNLKRAARAVGEKSIEMLKSKDLLPLTGYIHGGCSPLGMKKRFKTVFHHTAADYETVIFSAGKIGYQVEMCANDLSELLPLDFDDVADKQETV